ncbi:hypothetical protein BV372_18010 [Nostoc sp. T09]|nr:hypothetical protein BV372_18010 [Nostoc sp. T09]
MRNLKIFLVSCAIIYPCTSIINVQTALANTPASNCIQSLLYRNTSFDGLKRTELSEQMAVSICTGVNTNEQANSVKNCVESLLYRNTSFSGPRRTEISEDTAINACALSRNTPNSNFNNPAPGSNTININVNPGANQNPIAGGSPKAITDCMKRLMYEQKLVCTRNRCSHFPSEGFGGWEMQDVRTDVSETAAVQACQSAR